MLKARSIFETHSTSPNPDVFLSEAKDLALWPTTPDNGPDP
jgi:hypothetical protein